jgi:DNA-binding MarR family transcriptional regulator
MTYVLPQTAGAVAVSRTGGSGTAVPLQEKHLDIERLPRWSFDVKMLIMEKVADGVDGIVEQWARERPELDTTAMAVFGRIYRLARLSGDAVEREYAAFGLGRSEFDVLATLRRSGRPLSPGRLAAAMMLSSGGTTARLDRLERAGLVQRSPDPDDRRGVLVSLTDRGAELVDGAVAAGLRRQQELLAHLSPTEQDRLSALLRSVLAPLEGA